MEDLRYNTPWRRMATAIFERPRDGRVFGAYDIDVTDAVAWIDELRAEGHQVTPTHIVIAGLGRALAAVPELNCYVRMGRVVLRKNVTVAATVSIDGRDMGMVRVPDADRKRVQTICAEMRDSVERTRARSDQRASQRGGLIPRLPWPFRRWAVQFARWLTMELGLRIPSLGIDLDAFGSVLLTNVGSLGIAYGFPALMPASNLSFVVAMGKIVERPAYVDGVVVPRKYMPFGATFDHRIVDGAYIGRLQARFEDCLTNPRQLGEGE